MKRFLIVVISLAYLASCSQQGGGEKASEGKIISGAISDPKVEVLSELNSNTSTQYQLTTTEIEELFNSGTITEQQKQELLALVK